MGYAVSGKRQPLPSRAVQHVWTALRRLWRDFTDVDADRSEDLHLCVYLGTDLMSVCRLSDLRLMRDVVQVPSQMGSSCRHEDCPTLIPAFTVRVEDRSDMPATVNW